MVVIEVSLHSFSNLALYKDEQSTSRQSPFIPGKEIGTRWRLRGSWNQSGDLKKRKIPCLYRYLTTCRPSRGLVPIRTRYPGSRCWYHNIQLKLYKENNTPSIRRTYVRNDRSVNDYPNRIMNSITVLAQRHNYRSYRTYM